MKSSIRRLISRSSALSIVTAVFLVAMGPGVAFAHAGVDVVPMVTADGARDGHSVRLAWDEVIGARSYSAEYRLLGVPAWLPVADPIVLVEDPAPMPHGGSVTVTGLDTGSTYQFWVHARNSGGTIISSSSVKDVVVIDALMKVYRFYNKKSGSHFYTASVAEKASVQANLSTIYSLEGVAYTVNTANAANNTPLYRFYNKKNGSHFYTASVAEKDSIVVNLSATYALEGVAYNVCAAPTAGATTVYRFYNKKNGSHFYTASVAEKDSVQANLSTIYSLEGPAFYLAP